MSKMFSPVKGKVSSEWSKNRVNPATGVRSSHAGIDIAAPVGTDVFAAFGGVVEEVRTNSFAGDRHLWNGLKSGNFILIRNTDNARQWYGHLSSVAVKKGDKVSQGQRIGEVGKTGMVTGAHLHFEAWSNGSVGSHFNPRVLFERYNLVPGSTPPVKVGSKVIKNWQLSMNKIFPAYAEFAGDGLFGEYSESVTKIFQSKVKLPKTGKLDEPTKKAMRKHGVTI